MASVKNLNNNENYNNNYNKARQPDLGSQQKKEASK